MNGKVLTLSDGSKILLTAVCYGDNAYTFQKLNEDETPASEPGCTARPPEGESVSEDNAATHIAEYLKPSE